MEEQRGIARDAKRYCVREREREREGEIANARDKDRKKYCKRSGTESFPEKKKSEIAPTFSNQAKARTDWQGVIIFFGPLKGVLFFSPSG